MQLVSRYLGISEYLTIEDRPQGAAEPTLLLWNDAIAEQLNINTPLAQRAAIFSGEQVNNEVSAVALGYSGHQFGQFSPRLGDGRAHLLGAVQDDNNQLWDIQLKGSGATPFSRGGDGRCAIGPAIREYIMSEAMAALGIPTTRCLAVVSTGEAVYRQSVQAGAVVTRVASSHIRVGSFQYLATQGDIEGLKKLLDYAIETHYPEIKSQGMERIRAFLQAVLEKQLALVIAWMRVGFIHGVMNTDNTLISGETIDYGPCAMMDEFDFDTVFSSIDHHGRYAFGNQPNIANWNCARLAESLIPLYDDEEQAVAELSPVINGFAEKFNQAFNTMWAEKLGFDGQHSDDGELVTELLQLLKEHKLDYTNTFNALTESLQQNLAIPAPLLTWSKKWLARTSSQSYAMMRKANPAVIPRNHNMEMILSEYNDEMASPQLKEWLAVLKQPYRYNADNQRWYQLNHRAAEKYQTFCGT